MTGSVPQFLRRGQQRSFPFTSQDAAPDLTNTPYTYWSVSDLDPLPVTTNAPVAVGPTGVTTIVPVLNVPGTLLIPLAGRQGARVVNWLNKPVYIMGQAITGLPGPEPDPGTAYADFIPACVGVPGVDGVPGQYTFDYAPQNTWRYLVNVAFTGPGITVFSW